VWARGSLAPVSPYASDARDRVRDAVDFAQLVSARTELRNAGPNRLVGLCPFHEERTPSFGIDPVQKLYHCFGCGASGDLFTFVQETEGVDFKAALELLADRFGVDIEPEREDPRAQERRRRRERLLDLLERTTAYYERYLWESREAARAREYLAGRGLGEEILREFRVGYAPSAWDRVLVGSRRKGFSEQELASAGLLQRNAKTGGSYDRFRSRIMFPLSDMRGRVLGFGARAMRAEQGPKYLNSTDNELYHKGHHLYGANLARSEAARAGEVIVCEGYTDVIALHGAGMRNAVGLMGTAMTAEQVGELARLAPRVLLALDADSSGQEAMLRAARLAAERKLELRVVRLPSPVPAPDADGTPAEAASMDPAELVQTSGADAMRAAVEHSVPFLRFRVERVLRAGDYGSAEGRERILEELRPVFAGMAEGPVRLELVQLVSGRLALRDGMTERLLASSSPAQRPPHQSNAGVDSARRRGSPVAASGAGEPRGGGLLSRRDRVERAFLAFCIAFPKEGATALGDVELDEHFTSELVRRAAEHLRGHLEEPLGDVPADDAELTRALAQLVAQADALKTEEVDEAYSEAAGQESVVGPPNADTPRVSAESAAAKVRVQRLQLELALLERQIAARAQQGAEVSAVAARRAEVKRAFDQAQQRALDMAGSGRG
jgi:DNA primase